MRALIAWILSLFRHGTNLITESKALLTTESGAEIMTES